MDFGILAVIAMVAAVLFLTARRNSRWLSAPGFEYQRVFSAGAAGLLFFVSGLIGWDLSHSHDWFQGTKWVERPIWWQVGLGFGLLVLAGFWARRVPQPPALKRS